MLLLSLLVTNSPKRTGFFATLINAFSHDSLAVRTVVSSFYMLAHYLPYYLPHSSISFLSLYLLFSLFFSLFFTSSLPYPFLFHSIFFSDFLLIRSCIYLSDCVRPLCCLCVYTCDKRHWIICTTRENGWSCNKVMETLRKSRVESWGISRDLPASGLNRLDLKRVTFVFAPAILRESGENIEFMKVSILATATLLNFPCNYNFVK